MNVDNLIPICLLLVICLQTEQKKYVFFLEHFQKMSNKIEQRKQMNKYLKTMNI